MGRNRLSRYNKWLKKHTEQCSQSLGSQCLSQMSDDIPTESHQIFMLPDQNPLRNAIRSNAGNNKSDKAQPQTVGI